MGGDEVKIEVLAKPVFGKWAYYPHCEKARLFAKIANTTTLTMPVLMHIKELGYELDMIVEKPTQP
jgi:hypothetical protein